MKDTRTPQEKAYDDLKSGAVYVKHVSPLQEAAQEMDRLGISVVDFARSLPTSPVGDSEMLTRMQHFIAGYKDGQAFAATTAGEDDPEVTITPGDSDNGKPSWIEYRAGNIEITHDLQGCVDPANPFNFYIHGQIIEDMPITLAMLQGLMRDLGYLLRNDQVRAALKMKAA